MHKAYHIVRVLQIYTPGREERANPIDSVVVRTAQRD
jgi:hypothetical protein